MDEKWVQLILVGRISVAATRFHISEMYFDCKQMARFTHCAPGPLLACSVTGVFLLVYPYLHTYFLLCDQNSYFKNELWSRSKTNFSREAIVWRDQNTSDQNSLSQKMIVVFQHSVKPFLYFSTEFALSWPNNDS